MPAYRDARAFFAAYEIAVTSTDAQQVSEFYAVPCLAASPGFAGAATTHEELLSHLGGVRDFYSQIERGPTRVVDVTEQDLGAYHVFATVQWTAEFANVAAPIPFEVSYLLQRDGADGPLKILAFASHEDERALLVQHGLLPRDS